jgi:hypothetical protein
MAIGWSGRASVVAGLLSVSAAVVAATDPPSPHLESWRLGSRAVFVGTVTSIRRLGALDGLTEDTQGRMEAAIKVEKVLRAPAGVARPVEAAVRFDSRLPAPEGDGFYALATEEAVLVFADGFEPAYPRELFHGAPKELADQIKALRDFVLAMDAGALRLHGLTPATRASQVRLYDEALAVVTRGIRTPSAVQ